MARRRRGILGRTALLSLLLHGQILVLLAVFASRRPRAPAAVDEEPISVSAVDDETARQLLKEAAPAEKEPPGQVVEIPRPRHERRPDHARFVAEHDSSAERETKHQAVGDEQERAAASPAPPPAARPGLLAMREPERVPGAGPDTEPAAEPPPAPEAKRSTEETMAALLSPKAIARAVGGTHDHLADVDEGDETALNARNWKFAAFFNRVKEQIRLNWRPIDEYLKRDPTGEVYGSGNKLTLLKVVLHQDGSLDDVSLVQASGVDFLDDVAVDAVKHAQPFPNPPHELVDGAGVISFRFGFYFDVGGAPRLKVYRYGSL